MCETTSIPGWYITFQTDVLSQLPRPGEIDQETADNWHDNRAGLKRSLLETLVPPGPPPVAEPTDKFKEFVDLGIITIPADYDHATQLGKFMKKNRKKFSGGNENITDANFSNPSRVLKPGDKLRVSGVRQVVGGTTTSKERMDFLRSRKAVFTGAQGASLVFEEKRDQLPKGKWYGSFDEPERLWKDARGYHRVPSVYAYSDGDFPWNLGVFEFVWYGNDAFLLFRDLEPEPLSA